MRISIFILTLMIICGCTKSPPTSQPKVDDDYVLVEFASKLEEDYHRINNQPTDVNDNSNKKHP